MIIESFAKVTPKAQVDRTNSRLNGVVVMSTDLNLNHNANFTRINQDEIVSLGNTTKVYCYLGHPKKGITSNDRLPFRLGYFDNFSINGTQVKADLQLSPTIEANPILPQGIKEYIYTLAEKESSECGFSMSVGMSYNEDETVSILEFFSVDLVEVPALTVAMFAKEQNKMEENTLNESLTPVLDALITLSNAMDSKTDIKPSLEAIQAALSALSSPTSTEATEEPESTSEAELEAPTSEATEATEDVQEINELDKVKSDIASIKDMLAQILSSNFSKEVKQEPKKVVFSVMEPIKHESSSVSTYSQEVYNSLKSEKKYTEAAEYFKKFN